MSETQTPASSTPTLSIVIPFLNEEAVLEETYRRLKRNLDRLGESYELLFVDDGSTDQSRDILESKAQLDPTVRVLALSRNFGHEMATTAGLHHARGQAAIVMDADLQDPPELIETFVNKWREGYQVVYGVRKERRGEGIFKRTTSFLFYRLLRRVADISIPADTGDFRLLDRRVLDVYRQLTDDPRFFRGLISWIGFRQVGIPFVRHPRAGGRTKYRYGRLLRLALDTVTAFSTLPSQCISLLAVLLSAASFLFLTGFVALWICGAVALEGWMWAVGGLLILWNMQFLSLAVLGEYVVRTHRNNLRRPLYVVDSLFEGAGNSVIHQSHGTDAAEVTPPCHPSELCQT